MLSIQRFVLSAGCVIFFHSFCLNESLAFQWPQFGGPQRNFILDREPLDEEDLALSRQWQIEIGDGKSGLVVDKDSVYVCFRQDKFEGEDKKKTEYLEGVAALDRQTGKQQWIHRYDCSDLEDQESFSGDPRSPQATPALAADRIISLGFTGRLVCLDKTKGKVVWEKNLVEDKQINAEPVQFGFSASPVVVAERLFVFAGGEKKGLLCLNVSDGSEVWSCDCGEATYATPVVATLCGKQQIIIYSTKEVVSVDLQSGSILWRSDLPAAGLTNVPAPLPIGKNRLLISGQGAKGTYCLEVQFVEDKWTVTELWKTKRPQFFYCNWIPADDGNIVLGCTETMMFAISTADGKLKGRWRGFGNGNLLRIKNQILCVNGNGDLSLISTDAEGLTQEFECGVISGRLWAAPTLADDQLFLRAGKKLACYQVDPSGDLKNSLDSPESLKYRN